MSLFYSSSFIFVVLFCSFPRHCLCSGFFSSLFFSLSMSLLLFLLLSLFLIAMAYVLVLALVLVLAPDYVLGLVLTSPPHRSCISSCRFPCPLFFILSFFRTNTRITKKLFKPKITRAMLHFTTLDFLVCPRLVSNSLNFNFTSTFFSFLEVELKCL